MARQNVKCIIINSLDEDVEVTGAERIKITLKNNDAYEISLVEDDDGIKISLDGWDSGGDMAILPVVGNVVALKSRKSE